METKAFVFSREYDNGRNKFRMRCECIVGLANARQCGNVELRFKLSETNSNSSWRFGTTIGLTDTNCVNMYFAEHDCVRFISRLYGDMGTLSVCNALVRLAQEGFATIGSEYAACCTTAH